MPIYLDEDMVGQDPNCIAYPHLLLCMGVTFLLSDGSLLGAHITTHDTEAAVLGKMTNTIGLLPPGTTADRLYLTGNAGIHFGGAMDAHAKARALGYGAIVYMFDTSMIKPKDGTFVMLTSNGPGVHPGIQYKRNEKLAYTTAQVGRKFIKTGHSMVGTSTLNDLTTGGFFNKFKEVPPPH